jgi:hypothetical protein
MSSGVFYQDMFVYHFPQVFYEHFPTHHLRPFVFFSHTINFCVKFCWTLGQGFIFYVPHEPVIESRIIAKLSNVRIIAILYLLPDHIVDYNTFVSILVRSYHSLLVSTVPTKRFFIKSISFINMVQQNRKTIVVTEKNFEALRRMGTITESFNDVITKLLQNQKAAMSGPTLTGSVQNTASVSQPSESDSCDNG